LSDKSDEATAEYRVLDPISPPSPPEMQDGPAGVLHFAGIRQIIETAAAAKDAREV
tara:strand:+ start:2937 stop:3104 length:168 start_codon:yes stop_codon:yes gene_type:complete